MRPPSREQITPSQPSGQSVACRCSLRAERISSLQGHDCTRGKYAGKCELWIINLCGNSSGNMVQWPNWVSQPGHCWHFGAHPEHCGMVRSTLVSSTRCPQPPLSWDNQHCRQTAPNVPGAAKAPWVEDPGCPHFTTEERGPREAESFTQVPSGQD